MERLIKIQKILRQIQNRNSCFVFSESRHPYLQLKDVSVEQRVAESLRVGFGDETARWRGDRKHSSHLQHLQLLGGTPRAVNVQLVTHVVDIGKRVVAQH